VAGGDDAGRVGNDAAVVEEQVDVVLGGEEGTDVAVEHEVRLHAPLDHLGELGVGLVDQVAELCADLLLPVGQSGDVVVDLRIALVVGLGWRSRHVVAQCGSRV
jgi:hypothetical protein